MREAAHVRLLGEAQEREAGHVRMLGEATPRNGVLFDYLDNYRFNSV